MVVNLTNEIVYLETPSPSDILTVFSLIEQKIPTDSRGRQREPGLLLQIKMIMMECQDVKQSINQLFDVAQRRYVKKYAEQTDIERTLEHSRPLTRSAKEALHFYSRWILLSLWEHHFIILPLFMNFGPSGGRGFRKHLNSEVVRFLRTFEPTNREKEEFGNGCAKILNSECWKWIHATSWVDFCDINLQDANALRRNAIQARRLKRQSETRWVNLFIRASVSRHPLDISFSSVEWDSEPRSLPRAVNLNIDEPSEDYRRIAFQKLKKFPPRYPDVKLNPELIGTVYEFKKEDVSLFVDLKVEYQRKRISRGFESEKTVDIFFRKLIDYISFYLPTTLHLSNVDPKFMIRSPKDMKRRFHVDGDVELPFYTLMQFLDQFGVAAGSKYTWINGIRMFMEWVAHSYSDPQFAHIAGPEFINPISRLDLPRMSHKTVTNKKPIPPTTVPHLLRWLYCIEAFGIHLQSLGGRDGYRIGSARIGHAAATELSCEAYGFCPFYNILGVNYRLNYVPATMLFSGGRVGIVWLSLLRWMIFSIETGLRHQALQWLDRRFLSSEEGSQEDEDFGEIAINTDKSHGPFNIPVLKRVIHLLARQAQQEERGRAWEEVFYEGRPHTRFRKIEILFRSRTGKVISDRAYLTYWRDLLSAFQNFVNYHEIPIPPVLKMVEGELKPIHPPHSTRSSFITNRSRHIDLKYIAPMVGHASKVASSHYVVVDLKDVARKVLSYDHASPPPEIHEQRATPSYIHANAQGSPLRAALSDDRIGAISNYGIVSLAAYDDTGVSGLDLLRTSDVSDIAFRLTNICPVGENCPASIVEEVGGRLRCGSCRIACVTVDFLPAIQAKMRQLTDRLRRGGEHYERLRLRSGPQEEINQILEQMHTDSSEYLGWKIRTETLRKTIEDNSGSDKVFVEEPEFVRRHLKLVSKKSSVRELLLYRILDADAYPSLADGELRHRASRLLRKYAPGFIGLDLDTEDDPDEEIRAVAGVLNVFMSMGGLTMEKAIKALYSGHATKMLPPPG